jgi:hypothetical protein
MKALYRARQVMYYARTDRLQPPSLPPEARERLTEAMEVQFRILSNGDQRHLLRVYRFLKAHGAEGDTIIAGLLHDVGKACRKCNINVVDRCVHVFCNRFLPAPYRAFARLESPPQRMTGLHRLANHAHRGAEAARQAGYNERVQWLIRHHERGGEETDSQLQLLRTADDTAGPEYDL